MPHSVHLERQYKTGSAYFDWRKELPTMRMPGFTADISLYETIANARGALDRRTQTREQVVPQLFWGRGSVMDALGCEYVCLPNAYGAGSDCFWYCNPDIILNVTPPVVMYG